MADPIILVDYEFHYSSGAIDVVEMMASDKATNVDGMLVLRRVVDLQTTEETRVIPGKLDFYRIIQRTVEQ